MKVNILEFVEGARNARGTVIIIDVFRAFSVACYAVDSGASRIITTATVEEAFRLKTKYKNSVLAGERDERRIERFDFGNSPTEIIKTDLTGKTFIHTTTAGTQGLSNANYADIILTGSLVNAGAIIKYLKILEPEVISLVAMGYRAAESAEEDIICAEMIEAGINNKSFSFEKRIKDLQNTSGRRFFIPENMDFSPPTDFFLCTMVNRFDFVIKATKRIDGNIDLMRIDL